MSAGNTLKPKVEPIIEVAEEPDREGHGQKRREDDRADPELNPLRSSVSTGMPRDDGQHAQQ